MFRGLDYKCHFCSECDGTGCIAELPGMGGVFDNANFMDNVAGWKNVPNTTTTQIPIRLAPITGAVENIGYQDERSFYFDIMAAACAANIQLSLGDGCPDEKLQFGIAAVKAISKFYPTKKAAVFIKPYPNNRIIERIEWASDVAEIIGVDIDSYNIVTMRNKVQLEKKTAEQMRELQKAACVPFAVKGVFTLQDIEMVEELKPDIVVISNHGGRIETERGSTADFLIRYGSRLSKCCNQLWVDGGIRCARDVAAAASLGAAQVMIGRPFISALCRGGIKEVVKEAEKFR
ncbi:MAG: alpha-hydroxy-acid oxidizing protein [Spirochaetaceae bacterium]|nr:alpha-hydroxy-acid oxidizing protein [Spirochaetaceae bacterium]